MDPRYYPDGLDGRHQPAYYPYNQYLSPRQADEDRVTGRRHIADPSDDRMRRRNSIGGDDRSDDQSRIRVENDGELCRTRSSRRSTAPKPRDPSRAKGGKKAGRPAYVEDYDSDDWDLAKSEEQQGPESHRSKAFRGDHEGLPIPVPYGEYDNRYTEMEAIVIGGLPVPNMDISNTQSSSSHQMAYIEHHVLASSSDSYDTSARKQKNGAKPRKPRKSGKRRPSVSRRDRDSTSKQSDPRPPRQRPELVLSGNMDLANHYSRHTISKSMDVADHHARHALSKSIDDTNHHPPPAEIRQYGRIHSRSSSKSPQEDDEGTAYCASIPLRPSAEARAQSYHGSPASKPRPGSNTTKSFSKAQIPRLSVSQDPPNSPQSINCSIGPGDSRSDTETTKGRSRVGSGSVATSTSFLSLPTSPPGSGILGPKSYQYLPLADMEFRLIRVLPERMSKLKCEIVHRSLEDPPDYIAISYAWGDGVDTKPLVLQGATIPVAASLYDALKAIRQKKTEALVWVDALCIDQQNKDERATQVRLMGHIYSRATSVAIWLGSEADDSALAVQLLERVAQNVVSPQRIRSLRKYPDSAALFELFKRDYWKRLWVSYYIDLNVTRQVIDSIGRPRGSVSREEDGILRPLNSPLGTVSSGGRCFLGPG
jgi:hypothetical protein